MRLPLDLAAVAAGVSPRYVKRWLGLHGITVEEGTVDLDDIEKVVNRRPEFRTEKACSVCVAVLPLEEFHRDSKSRDGRDHRCKECQSVRARKKSRGM